MWNVGAYDSGSNLTYWGIGNPSETHFRIGASEIIFTPIAWSR